MRSAPRFRFTLLAMTLVLATAAARASAQAPPPQLPPASTPPPAPVAARPTPAPPVNAVALCNDQSFVVAPATPEACGTRGGLKLTLPTRQPPPARPSAAQPAIQAGPSPMTATPPADATMRCKDGTWLAGTPSAARCDANGGLATILPPKPPPGAPPRRP